MPTDLVITMSIWTSIWTENDRTDIAYSMYGDSTRLVIDDHIFELTNSEAFDLMEKIKSALRIQEYKAD